MGEKSSIFGEENTFKIHNSSLMKTLSFKNLGLLNFTYRVFSKLTEYFNYNKKTYIPYVNKCPLPNCTHFPGHQIPQA